MSRISVWKPLARKSGGLDQMITGGCWMHEALNATVDTGGADALVIVGFDRSSSGSDKDIYSVIDGVVKQINNYEYPRYRITASGTTVQIQGPVNAAPQFYWVFF